LIARNAPQQIARCLRVDISTFSAVNRHDVATIFLSRMANFPARQRPKPTSQACNLN
jgi:hypothetical protein